MPKDTEKRQPGFQTGHERYGGRKRNTVAHARALAEECGVEPMRFLMLALRDGSITKTVVGEDGKKKRVTVELGLDMILDIGKYLCRFLHPTLSAAQVQAQVDVDLDAQVAVLPTSEILANPKLAASLSELAMLVAHQSGPDEGQRLQRLLPAPAPDALDSVVGD